MENRWQDDDVLDAVGTRGSRAAVLEPPARTPPEHEAQTQPLGPAAEHSRETVVAFPGNRALNEGMEQLLEGVVTDFLEEAPRHGYRNVVIACDPQAPFAPAVERVVAQVADSVEHLQARFTTDPRRVDLFVVFERAIVRERGAAEGLSRRLLSQGAAEVLVVAGEDESGQLFLWALSGFLTSERCEAVGELVPLPPAPGDDLRVSQRMFQILSRTAPA